MLSIILLIVTFSLGAAESSSPSPSLESSSPSPSLESSSPSPSLEQALSPISHDNKQLIDSLIENPQLVGQLNFGDIQKGYEFAWKEYGMPPEISPIMSAITHVTNRCIYPSNALNNVVAKLEKLEEKHQSTLETTSTIAVAKDLQAHLFARLAQAYLPHNLEKSCIYACKSLNVHFKHDQSKIVIDPALAYLLAHQLQHDDNLRTVIHNTLPQGHQYAIGQSLVMAKPTTAALVTQAIAYPELWTSVDRAFLSWLKRYYKNDSTRIPVIIASEVFDKLLLACRNSNHNLQQFINPLLKTQYARTHHTLRGELAFQLYLDTYEKDKPNEDAITYLIDAVNNSQKGTQDTIDIYGIAFNEAIELWDENRELAHLLLQALAKQGYSPACDFVCNEFDITHNNQIASNLLYAAMQGNTPTVQKYVVDNFHFIRTECPTLITPIKKYLQQLSSGDDPEIRLKAKFMDSTLNAEIDDSIKELETFTQALAKKGQMTPLQEQAFDEAHRCLADLYQVKVNEFVAKSVNVSIAAKRGTATPAGKAFKKLHDMSAQRAQKSVAIASRSKNPIIQIRTLLTQSMHKSTTMLCELLQRKATKLNAQDKQQLAENNKNILTLVTRLQQTPASDEYAVFGMRNAQITKTHLIIEGFHFLANIEKQLNNVAAYHSHLCQAFNEDPTDPRNVKLIEDIVAKACKENNTLTYKQTEMLLNALVISHPDEVQLHMHQATLARAQQESSAAIIHYCNAGELGSAEAWYKAATVEEMLGNLQSAHAYYTRALKLDPQNSTYKLNLDTAAYKPGLIAWKKGSFNEAVACWQPLEHTNHLAAFRLGLFKLYGDGGSYSPEEAHQYFERAKSLITPEERASNAEIAGMQDKYRDFANLAYYQFHKSDMLQEVEQELLEQIAKPISNILKQEAYIALALQRTFVADDLEAQANQSAASPDDELYATIDEHRNVARQYLKNASQLAHTPYSPRVKYLFAYAVKPASSRIENENELQALQDVYRDIIERGPKDNHFVQIAQIIVQKIDAYLAEQAHQSVEN